MPSSSRRERMVDQISRSCAGVLLQRPRFVEQAAAQRPAVLVVFDLLELEGEDLRPLPLLHRRDAVHWFGSPVPGIQAIEYIETHGEALFRQIARHDQDGHCEAP